ncbi:MAG TPA: MlaD family protein [Bacteroidia bacterium]|jgi:phospholipid/cholesterol/gamma-HCH transport system substrate-binding protein|nr:MlaD family protein [Bacteroidia bacterium]
MQNKASNKIKLTLFVFIAGVLFAAGIYFIGEKQQMFNKTFKVSGIFKDVDGLKVGNNVRFSGINVGTIDDIKQITDTNVKVDMQINEDARKFIKKDARAVVGSDGLMGDKIVTIIPGTVCKEILSDNDVLKTSKAMNTDDILFKLKVTSDNAADLSGNLSSIMKNIVDGKGTAGKLLMDTAFAQNIDQALVNLKEGIGGFKRNMDAAGKSVLLRGPMRRMENQKKK